MNEDILQQDNNQYTNDITNSVTQRQQEYAGIANIGYGTEQYLQDLLYPTPKGSYPNYGPTEYLKDAFTSWVTGLNQAQYSADMGKFMLAQDEINDLQNAEKYLNAIGEGFDYSSIDPSIIEGYTKSMDRLGLDSRSSVDELYNRINQRIVELTEDQNEYLQDANTDLQDLQDWLNKWEISDYYKQKEAEPTDYTIDSLLYKLPGIMGSSSSSVGWQALGMLGSLVGTAGSIALAPVTGGGSVLAWGALAAGAAASLTGNIMAGRDENAAEVYDNLKDAITQDLSKNGNYNDLIKQGRSLLKEGINAKELNIPEAINSEDVDKMTDDRVMDYILNGTVNTSNSNLERAVNDRLPATGELYLRDMATTVGTDILTTAIDVLPIGIFSRGTRLGRWGVNTYSKMKNSVLGSKLATKLDQAVHFGLSKEAQNVIHRRNIDFAYNIAKRNIVSALAEGPGEEGIQYLNGQDFINSKYGQETPSWVEAYVDAMIDKAQSVWAFMMPFDAAEKYDDEWLENSRSGLLMGVFNFPSVVGNVRDVAQNVRNNQALRAVQDGLIQKVFEDKTQWNQAKYFADRVDKLNNPVLRRFTSGETAINDAFNAFSDFMPDEFTQDMWQAQRDIFNNVRNLAKSKTVRQLAEQRGFNPGSEEYNTYLALLEYKRQKRAQALEDNKRVGQEVDKEVSDIRNRSKEVNQQLFDLAHANAKIEAANRIVELYENQQEDAEAYGVRVNKRDLVRAKQIAKEMRDRYKDVAKKNENDLGFVIASSVELPNAQEDLVQAEMKRLFMDIDLQVHTEDYNSLYVDKNGSPRIEYVDENGEVQSRELTNTEKQKAIDYSKEIVQRFINVDKYNRKLQQDLRTGGEQNTTTEIAIPDEGNDDNNVPPVTPLPSPEPQGPTNPTPPSTPPVPTSEETKPEVEPKDTNKESSSQTLPTLTTSQPTDDQPANEPSAPDQLPPMPENAVIPGVDEEPSLNISESDSLPLQDTQTPSSEQDITSEPESHTESLNTSTDVSTTKEDKLFEIIDKWSKALDDAQYTPNRLKGRERELAKKLAAIPSGLSVDRMKVEIYNAFNSVGAGKYWNNIYSHLKYGVSEDDFYNIIDSKPNNNYRQYLELKPETLSKEKIKELNDKLNAVRELAYEELKDPKYNDIANKDLIQTLRTVLSTIDITVNENSDPSIEQDVDNYINNVQNLLEQLRNEYQKYLENKTQTDVIDTYSKGGYSLVIKQEDQAKSIRILNADDLLDTAEINVDSVDENGYPLISISYKGETLHATLLYSDRQDPSTALKYPELVNKLRSWLELVRQNPNKYKIVPIGLQRTNGMLIKQNPGQTINMTQVSFWNDVLKGYGVVDPTDPYQINENNFILAIVDLDSNLRRMDDIYYKRKKNNKGWGDVFWIARIPRKDVPGGYVTHRVMINPTRLNKLKGSAEVIVEALRQFIVNDNPTAAFMQNGKESPFTPTQVLNLLTYFNNDPEYDKRLSPQENQWRMRKSIAYYADKGQIKIADKIFDVNAFLSSEDVRNQVVQMLYSEQYQFHIPIYEEALKGMYGADFVRKENPLAPLHRFFEMRPEVRKYELFPGMDFTPDMAGLGKHKDGINWLGYMVSRGLINPGYTAIQNRVYASDFQLIQAGNDTNTQESNTIDTAIDTDEHTDEDSGNPFADAFGGMDLNFTSRTKPELMTEDRKKLAKRIIAKLTDLSEDQVDIIDDIIATVSGGMHVMGRAKLDSIVLSGYDIPGIEYHEAWHRISNLLMSPQLREKVFRQVRKKFGKNLTDTQVDEILAERFREFLLDTAEVIDYNTTNLFKRVWNFIRTWARLGSLRLARIYYTINTGGYTSVKPSAENIARFKALYQNEGPNFTFNGADFKQFANRYALNKAIDSLMYYVFYNPNSKVSFYKDAENINFLPLYQMLKRSKNPALQELAQDDNWNAVKLSLTQRLQQLSIRVSDVEESELENLADSGALAKVNMDDYVKASYEIDVFGNQTADVKFFLSTVPQYAPDYKTGIFKPVLDEVTGLPKFYDVRYIWNVASTDLGKCKTLLELLQEVDRLSATDYMYAGIRWKLNQYLKLANSEDEATRTDAEGSITRILTALRKQRLQFDTVRVNRTEEGSYNMYLVNNTVDNKTRILPSTWSLIFLNQSGIFSIDDNNNVTITESGRKQLRRVLTAYNSIKNAFQNNGVITIGGEQYDLHVPVNQSRLKNYLVNMFALIGIHVEQGTINQLLKDPKYGQDSYTKLYNLFNRSDISYGGIPRLFLIILSIADSNNVLNVVIADKATPIGEIYNKLGFINELAVADVIFHTNHDNLMEIGAGNNLIYSKSDNNFISDRTDQLNANDQTVEKLLEHPWNHYYQEVTNDDGTTSTMSVSASIILSAVQRGVKLRLSVLLNFKTDNYGDQGSDYQLINDIEDYISKMELVLNNRLIFPTMEAKKTYYSISGVELPYGGIVDVRNLGDLGEQFIFGDEILDRFINYFQADYNAAMTTISQLTEGSPDFIPEDQRITNYHTKVRWFDKEGKVHYTDPNGTRMRMFTGMYTVEQCKDGKLHYKYIHFDDPNKSSAEILRDAKARFFDQPIDIKRSIVNKILSERLKDELQYCIDIGLIEGNLNDFRSIRSTKLDQNTLMQRTGKFKNNAHAMGVIDVIADTMNRSMVSFIEVQKAFVGDPAFFKWTYDEQGLVENTIDLIKRHGGLISTGINNRIDLDDFNPTYRVAELKDYKQGSDQLDYLLKLTSEGYLIEFIKQLEGISEATGKSIDELKKQYPELWDAALIKAKSDFGGYQKGINVADAAVYITPRFYARLMRSVGEWSEEIKEAYEILQDDNSDWYSQTEAYHKVMKASFRALKYVAYGTRFENGNAVPYFNKMALFPVFKNIATGDMSKVYERMTREDDGVDMLMFESAVKVGSKHPTDVSNLDDLVVYEQDILYLRQQLNTKGHPEPHINVGTQMLKVALGNLDMLGDYNGVSGESIKQNIMSCINNLSDRGVERLNKQFLDEFGTLDVEKFAKRMLQYLQQNPGNDNLVNAVQIVEDPITHNKRLKLPISALSDASFLESVFLSMINSETVDINMPGGAFIQRSAFGVYDSMNIVSDSELNHGKKLKMIDEKDGSMHSIVSITMFRDLLPNFDDLTFAQLRKALIDAGIIGENSQPIGIGYRIPTQAQASISALKFVDVLPAVMEDTIILPEEFTKLTGSDFDIDKLYVIRYSFNEHGRIIRYDESKSVNENSEQAVKNFMILNYIKVLTSGNYQQLMKISIDNATETLKDVLAIIEKYREKSRTYALSSYLPSYQCAKKSEYTIGKAGIGPFALNNAHHVLTQLTQLRMADTAFNRAFETDRLDKQYDNDGSGRRILDWLSALINAFVDIAKDPFVIRLNVNAYTYNMTAYLLRMGYGQDTFFLLNQPVIIELARRILNVRGNFGKPVGISQFELERLITEQVLSEYDVDYDSMLKMILDWRLMDADNPQNIEMLTRIRKDAFKLFRKVIDGTATESEKREANRYAAELFFAFNSSATSMSNLVKYSKIDTKKHGKSIAEWEMYIRGMNELRDDPNFYEGDIQRFYDETFIGHKTSNTVSYASIFDQTMLRASDGFKNRLDNILRILGKSSKMDADTLNRLVGAMESGIKAQYINEAALATGRYENIYDMFYGEYSVPRRLLKLKSDIKQGKYPDLLTDDGSIANEFLNYLYPNVYKTSQVFEEPDFIDTRMSTTLDINMLNEIIYSWDELLHHPNEEVRELAEDLIYYAFYTSGDLTNPNSFFRFVPFTWREGFAEEGLNQYDIRGYGSFIQGLLTNETNPNYDMLYDSDVFLNNWLDDKLVPTIPYQERIEVPTPTGITFESVSRYGIPAKSVINGTNIHPMMVFFGEFSSKSSLYIKPVARISLGDRSYPIYSPYVKMQYTPRTNINGTIVYKLIGMYVHTNLSTGSVTYRPVYAMVNKKGFSYRGHRIVEYGVSAHFDFNDFYDAEFQPISELDFHTRKIMEYVSKSIPNQELQRMMLNSFDLVIPISDYYQKLNMQDYTDQHLFEEYDQSNLISDDGSDKSQPMLNPVQDEAFERRKVAIPILAKEWSKKEGWNTEHFYREVLPHIDEAWSFEFTVFPNNIGRPMFQILMNYPYKNEKRSDVKSNSTLEAIKNGERTSTTRYERHGNIPYLMQMKVGDSIRFYNKYTDEEVYALVTKPLYKLSDRLRQIEIDSDPTALILHSGGATGADSVWSKVAEEFGIPNTPERQKHYYADEKTPIGNVEVNDEDYEEGRYKVAQAAKANWGYEYNVMKDPRLIRDWSQVKYSDAVFAIGHIVKPGERIFPNKEGDTRTAKQVAITGGTGYAVEMAIQSGKPVYVYDQYRKQWYKNINGIWSKSDIPVLTKNFAGIGTRQINQDGVNAIRQVFHKTFERDDVGNTWTSEEQDISKQIQGLHDALEELGYNDDEISNLMHRFHQENDANINNADDAANLVRKFICNL